MRFARQCPLCRPLISTCFSFVSDTSDTRARHYIGSMKTIIPVRRFSEVCRHPGVIQERAPGESQSQTMRLRSLELGKFEIATRVAITLYHSLIGLASVQQMFGGMCVLGAGYSCEHSDVFVMGLEFARVREQHNCSLNVLLEVGA